MNLDPIAKAVFDGLLSAYKNHKILGDTGRVKDKLNRFGEMALRGDLEAEECVMASLKKVSEEQKFHIICRSEEMGKNDINPGGLKNYFAVFDGLDGSGNYLNKSDYGYGTLVAVADGLNPRYEDFIVAGEAMMEDGKIVLALKNKGVFVYEIESDKFTELPKFAPGEVFDDSKTLANKYFPEELEAYGDMPWIMTGSTSWSIYSICTGSKFNALIEVTRKGNLEQPILYLMISELGGVMVDKNGESIGSRDFKSWGQSRNGEEFVITAKNNAIAEAVKSQLDTNLK